MKQAELKKANPEDKEVIWYRDEEGNILKKTKLGVSAQKLLDKLEVDGFNVFKPKFEIGDTIVLTKEIPAIFRNQANLPVGLKGEVKDKRGLLYRIDFQGVGMVDVVKSLAEDIMEKTAAIVKEEQIGAQLKEWEGNKAKMILLQKQLTDLRTRQTDIMAEIRPEVQATSDGILEIDEYVVKYKQWEQRKAPSYKKAFEKLLTKVNGKIRKIAEDALEETISMSTRERIDVIRKEQEMHAAAWPEFLVRWWKGFMNKIKSTYKAIANTLRGSAGEMRRLTEEAEKAPDVLIYSRMFPTERFKPLSQVGRLDFDYIKRITKEAEKELPKGCKVFSSELWNEDKEIKFTTDKGFFIIPIKEVI